MNMTPKKLDLQFSKLTRFKVVSSLIWDNSWNVIDTKRMNAFGEPWVELCAVTLEQAVDKATEMNKLYAHTT